ETVSKDLKYNDKTPDLTIEKNGHKFIVECTLLRPPANEDAYKNLRNAIEADINKLQVLNRGINIISMKLLADNQPSVKGFIQHLKTTLLTQPLNERQVFKTKDYIIEYKPYEVKSSKTPLIVGSISEIRVVDGYHDAKRFRDSFVIKAKKYKDIGLPYIICIKSLDFYVSKDDILTAINGGSVYNIDTKEISMLNDGIFTSAAKSYERISAIIYKTGSSDLQTVLNPRAKTLFPMELLTEQS
ncbi:hypothetical protein, partial [Flavobacterium sp.]|uniref:hypothetical protein n=1 Tax=Flavobacterium sp. TaxID=239 RepID=UPI0026388F0C